MDLIVNVDIFKLTADEIHQLQVSDGGRAEAIGVRWMLLLGHLFLRMSSALSTPLFICYIATSLADLVGCADKLTLVLSFRSIGFALQLALLASFEGVLTMWITHKAGLFQGCCQMLLV